MIPLRKVRYYLLWAYYVVDVYPHCSLILTNNTLRLLTIVRPNLKLEPIVYLCTQQRLSQVVDRAPGMDLEHVFCTAEVSLMFAK